VAADRQVLEEELPRRERRPLPRWAQLAGLLAIGLVLSAVGRIRVWPELGPAEWRVVGQLSVANPGYVAYGAGRVWVVDLSDCGSRCGAAPVGNLYQFDAATGELEDIIPHAVAAWPVVGDGAVWLGSPRGFELLTRVDLGSDWVRRIASTTRRPAPAGAMVTRLNAVRISDAFVATVSHLEKPTGRVRNEIQVVKPCSSDPFDLVTDATTLFVAAPVSGEIVRINAATGRVVSRIRVAAPGSPDAANRNEAWHLALDGTTLYALGTTVVYRIDISTAGAEKITGRLPLEPQTDGSPIGLRVGHGSLWVMRQRPVDLLRIDLRTFHDAQQVQLPHVQYTAAGQHGCLRTAGLDLAAGAVWLRLPGQVLELRRTTS
jgi:hypothetical protein